MDEQEATDRLASIKICSVVKQLADHVKTDNKLEYIKFCASYALVIACQKCGVKRRYDCDPSAQKRLIATVISIYLQLWMKSDPKAGRNFNAFYDYGYCDEIKKRTKYSGGYGESYPFFYSRETLFRQKQKYECIEKNIAAQAQNESRGMYEPDEEAANQQNYACRLSWDTLCLLDKMSEGKVGILNYLLERKTMFEKGSHCCSNEYLYDCYQDYYDLYRSLDPRNPDTKSMSDIEYVSMAMMLQGMERSYRFHAAALLAKEISEKIPSFCFDDYEQELRLFWGRFAHVDEGKQSVMTRNSHSVFEYSSRDILSYPDKIQYLCSCKKDHNPEFLKKAGDDIMLEREVLLLLLNIIPPQEMPPWKKTDYRNARSFFETDYPIYQVYLQVCSKSGILDMGDKSHKRKKDTAYDTIRAFLNWMISCEKEDRYCDKAMGREHLNQQLREFRTTSYKTKHDRRGRPPKLVKNPTESDGGKEETTNAIENDAAKQKEIGVE